MSEERPHYFLHKMYQQVPCYAASEFSEEQYRIFNLCNRNALFYYAIASLSNWYLHDTVVKALEKQKNAL